MKKIIFSICILPLVFTAMAQTQAEIDKAMKDLKDIMKTLPPEAQQQVKKSMGQLPSANIAEIKKNQTMQ
jgi:hypothetical protein